MKRIVLSLFALGVVGFGLAGIVPSFPSQVATAKLRCRPTLRRRLTVDIAMDGRTRAFQSRDHL